jgi:hypothetical protein
VRIPWGFKGPHDFGWGTTPYAWMRRGQYFLNLDAGNLGLLCGWDRQAVEAGLVPAVVVVGLDADEAALAGALLEYNPWLAHTFAVDGARGRKWFFAVGGPDAAKCPRSCKIKRLDPRTGELVEVWVTTEMSGNGDERQRIGLGAEFPHNASVSPFPFGSQFSGRRHNGER